MSWLFSEDKVKQQQLKDKRNTIKTNNENLKEFDYENMMKHSSYRRGKGGIRQVRWVDQ